MSSIVIDDAGTSGLEAPAPAREPLVPGAGTADIRLATGVRLRHAEQGRADGRPVILLHGYSDTWLSYARVLPLLPERLRLFALDQRGHGHSERPAQGYRMQDLARDVVAFMDAKGIARATIVGHSMGGLVAQQVAALAAARVEGLVLVDAPSEGIGLNEVEELRRMVYAQGDPVSEEFVREFQYGCVGAPVPVEFMDRMIRESRRMPAHVWRGIVDGMIGTGRATELSAARIPALLLWGDLDAVVSRPQQEVLLSLLQRAELRVYEGVGHTPHWEVPESFARDLVGFVDGLSDG